MKRDNELQLEDGIFNAINHPKYYHQITNRGKAYGQETKVLKPVLLSDFKKYKPGTTLKLIEYSRSQFKWNKFSFKFEKVIKRKKGKLIAEICGKSRYNFDYPLLVIWNKYSKRYEVRTGISDSSPLYYQI